MTTEGGVRGLMRHGNPQNEIYFIGIIDMLQHYNVNKKVERGLKRGLGKAAEGISSINSPDYAARFMRHMNTIFV